MVNIMVTVTICKTKDNLNITESQWKIIRVYYVMLSVLKKSQ